MGGAADAENALTATIASTSFLGPVSVHTLRVGDHTLRARNVGFDAAPGAHVNISLPPSGAFSSRRRPRDHARDRAAPLLGWLMLLPVVALCAFVVAAPIVNLLFQSLAPAAGRDGLTVAHYTRFFTDPFFLSVLGRSFRIAALVVLLCLVIGWPVAFYLSRCTGARACTSR